MHKGYRELLAKVEAQAADLPQLRPLLQAVEQLDDLNPLTVPAVKAMLRDPAPPLELTLVREDSQLVVYARNTARKRRATQATRVTALECPPWFFESAADSPGIPAALRLDMLELVKESLTLLGHRISNSFSVTFRDRLLIQTAPPAHLWIAEVPLAQRLRLNPDPRRSGTAV